MAAMRVALKALLMVDMLAEKSVESKASRLDAMTVASKVHQKAVKLAATLVDQWAG